MPNPLGYLSLALYVASFICYARNLSAPNMWVGRLASLLLAGGIFVQYLSLYQRSLALHTVPYDDLYGSMSLFAWLLGITYLGLELFHRQHNRFQHVHMCRKTCHQDGGFGYLRYFHERFAGWG